MRPLLLTGWLIPSLIAPLAAQPTVPDRPTITDPAVLRETLATAKLQLAGAVAKALERVPGLALRASLERIRVDGKLVPRFEVEVLAGDGYYEIHVDAQSGEVTRCEPQTLRRAERLGEMVFDFEQEPLPVGFEPAENGGSGKPASWRTERAADAPDGRRVLVVETGNARQTFNLLPRRGRVGPDLTVSVELQAWKGVEDQGGGLIWRAKDADHYYIARWNPLERNLRLYTVVAGKRSLPIQSVEIDAEPDAWHELSVTMVGPRIVLRFDGRVVIEAEDTTFPDAGAVGLWTKADASTRFDSLRILPLR